MDIKKNFQTKDIQIFKFLKALILDKVSDKTSLHT